MKKNWEKVREAIKSKPITLGPLCSGQLKGHWSLLRKMARYKFVANLVKDKRVLDVGCSEGLGAWMLGKYTSYIHGIDTDLEAINKAKEFQTGKIRFTNGNIFDLSIPINRFDCTIAIDVIEHIPKKQENNFMKKLTEFLNNDGFCIIGTPNKNMKKYEAPESKAGHINMYDYQRLEKLMKKYFRNVFIFGMNDEVVYTGFKPMCQYIMAMGVNKI